MQFDLYQAVSDLQAKWPSLPDVDRADALVDFQHQLSKNGVEMSGRTLAAALGCAESLLRHIAPIADATAAEKQLSRDGKISTRKLSAIIRQRRALKDAEHKKAELARDAKAAEKGAKDIVSFFRKERILPSYAEQVWKQALGFLRAWEQDGLLARQRPEHLSTADIASRCWPAFAPNGDTTIAWLNCCAHWLAMWTSYAIPNTDVRGQAYRRAWSLMIKGYSLP